LFFHRIHFLFEKKPLYLHPLLQTLPSIRRGRFIVPTADLSALLDINLSHEERQEAA
jgi:hypothetical protein